MATIDTSKKTGSNEFTSDIVILRAQAKGARIVPDLRATGENAPSRWILVDCADYAERYNNKSPEKSELLAKDSA
ncbi:uncharacterized protein (DUF736 family) [Pseudochelatococcus lubricantis]|uniref:Uncharacterized protein (DUF736 family) n=1 Tax=Pseudochelatococcus lubricantis TaxID=1538102 RepID=A0ABX0V510_9HYPH|nr:uncharacterized protein (DUF736 family) [Pseudochelatococcus lubricantis]